MSVELQPPTMTVGELKGSVCYLHARARNLISTLECCLCGRKLFDTFNGKRRVGDPALHPKGPSHCIFKVPLGCAQYFLPV